MIMKFHCTVDEKLFGGTEFQNRFKKHRKHLFNLDSLEKTVFEPNIFVSLSSGFNARVTGEGKGGLYTVLSSASSENLQQKRRKRKRAVIGC